MFQVIIENTLIYFNTTVRILLLLYFSNRVTMHCNEASFQELLECFDNNLSNDIENNAWKLEHNVEKFSAKIYLMKSF